MISEEKYVKPCGCGLDFNCRCINFMWSQDEVYEDQCEYAGVLPSGNRIKLRYFAKGKWHDKGYFIVIDDKILKSVYDELKKINPSEDIKIEEK